MEDLESKESVLKDVETRTQLSLRFGLNLYIKQLDNIGTNENTTNVRN